MNHEQWLAARRLGVSGTDIATLLGHNPYKSEPDLILDKLGVGKPFVGNAATRAGQTLEPYVANAWAKRHQKIIINGSFSISEENDKFIGTPDFEVGDESGLEIKTGAENTYKAGCPKYYEDQCRWYMMIRNKQIWNLAACIVPKDRSLIPKDDLLRWVQSQPHREYQFHRDLRWEELARQRALDFLEKIKSLRESQLRVLDLPGSFG